VSALPRQQAHLHRTARLRFRRTTAAPIDRPNIAQLSSIRVAIRSAKTFVYNFMRFPRAIPVLLLPHLLNRGCQIFHFGFEGRLRPQPGYAMHAAYDEDGATVRVSLV